MRGIKAILVLGSLISVYLISCKKENKPPAPIDEDPIVIDSMAVFEDVKLGNHNEPDYGSFLDLKSGQVYKLSESPKASDNQARIDLVYYYNSQDHTKAFLGAPSSVEENQGLGGLYDNNPDGITYWNTINETSFKLIESVSVGDFIGIDTYSELKAAWGNTGLMPHYEYDVKSGKIYRFVTENQKIGLLRIKNISGNGNVPAIMTVDIKIEK